MLKPGKNNKKLGDVIQKLKWRGMKMYALTLEERESCPDDCDQWDTCYGNNMPFAHRFDHMHPAFYVMLDAQLQQLSTKHPNGFVVRLHVLGDFFDMQYVRFWKEQLEKRPTLHIFGFTHHDIDTDIGQELQSINQGNERSRIRFSNSSTSSFSAHVIASDKDTDGVICPEQTGKTDACTTCGYCWSSDNPIYFLSH
jgi:hypothetical protein